MLTGKQKQECLACGGLLEKKKKNQRAAKKKKKKVKKAYNSEKLGSSV